MTGQAPNLSRFNAAILAMKRLTLLDSGMNEGIVQLTDKVFCIARPQRGPLLLERGDGFVTIYCEIALWGKN